MHNDRFVGKNLRQTTPLSDGVSTQVPQLVALQEWADMSNPGMLVAVDVCVDQRGIEGAFILAKLHSCALELPEDALFCGQEFKQGWLVVEASW